MKSVFLAILLILTFVPKLWADEITLIESNKPTEDISDSSQEDEAEEEVDEDDEPEEEAPDQQLSQMDDFIQQEDEKLKKIRLLGLDLERSNLELKKREVEDKISQLTKSNLQSNYLSQDNAAVSKPSVRVLSVFEGKVRKQAVLNINGSNINVKEGDTVGGIKVKSIRPDAVVVEYQDGDIGELYLS